MEPLQGDTVTNDSCSCTSYDYNSESDCQTLIRLLAQGCRINRVFNGKYLPLRESKLLDKLIRTRALYDALRSQLLSSSLSVSSITNLKQGQEPTENSNSLEAKKSSDMFALVDLVDKGAVLGSRKLSVCCSCCNCNSKAHLQENVQKGRRNRQTHAGALSSRSSVTSKHGTGEEFKLGKQFKAKNIKSDPCTRASKFEELIKLKLQSRVILKKIRPEQPRERDQLLTIRDKHKFLTINNEQMRKSYHKLKRYKARPTQYIENMGEGGIDKFRKLHPNQDSFELKTMSSIEQLKIAEKKIKDSFSADRKATQKSKPEGDSMIKNIPENNAFSTKKNTGMKFNDKVSNKHQLQDSEFPKRVDRTLKRNDQAGKDNKTMNVSGTPNLSIRKERYAIPERTVINQQNSPPRKGNKNDTSFENKKVIKDSSKIFNKMSHAVANSIKLQKPKETDPFLVLQGKKSVKLIKSNLDVRDEQYPIPKRTDDQQQSTTRKRIKTFTFDEKHKGTKAISKVLNQENHGMAVSIKLQNPKESYPSLVLRDKKKSAKSMSSINSNLGVRKEQFASPGRMPSPGTKRQKNPTRKRNKYDTLDEKENVKNISKPFKVTHATENSIKKEKPKESYHSLSLRDKKKSAKSMTSIISPEIRNKLENLPLSTSQEKKPIKSKIRKKLGKHLKSNSTTSIEKFPVVENEDRNAHQAATKKSSLNLLNNKNKIKSDPMMQKPKKMESFDAPMRFVPREQLQKITTTQHEENGVHEDPDKKATKKKQKKKRHALKRCLCTLKIKIKKTKSAITKIVAGEIPQGKDAQSIKTHNSETPHITNTVKHPEKKTAGDAFKSKYHDTNLESEHQSVHKDSLELKNRKKSTHVSKCECSNTAMNINQNRGSNNEFQQTKTHSTTKPSSNHTIAKANNNSAHITTPHKTTSLRAESECECLVNKKNVSLKYKQTNTHTDIKSTNNASTETKEKQKFQNNAVQTINNVMFKEKQSRKLYPGHKTNTTHHETKSIFNRITKCKCPIVMKENIIASSKKYNISDNYNSKPRFTVKFPKKAFSKDRFKIPLQTQSLHKDSLELKAQKNLLTHASTCQCSDIVNINNVTIKKKQSRKLHPGYKTNMTHHETKSIFSRITKCKCPIIIKENIIVASKEQKINDNYNVKPRFTVTFSKKSFSKDVFKIPLEPQSVHKDNLVLKDRKKISTHASKCECSDIINNNYNMTIKEKQSRKLSPGPKTNTNHYEPKSIFNHITMCKCPIDSRKNIILSSKKQEISDDFNSKQRFSAEFPKKAISKDGFKIPSQSQSVHKDNPELKDRKQMSTNASRCECSINMNIKQNKGSNNELHTTAKAKNDSAHISAPQKIISLSAVSECECLDTKEKGSLKYNQTNIHSDIKSTINHVFPEIKEKEKFINHSMQTMNNVTIPEKQSRKLHPEHKITRHETRSFFNRITKCKCPIIIKENIIESLNKKEISDDYNSKPRISSELSKKRPSKGEFQVPLDTHSKIKQADMHTYKSGPNIHHKQSQLSNSTGKLKYTAAKHGLRRCFCTLKLGKFEKKKNKLRKKFKGAVSSTGVRNSDYLETQRKVRSISILTERTEIYQSEAVLSRREARSLKKHIKGSTNRSNSSFTSRSMQLPRSKKVHSILVSHKSEIPIQVLQKNQLSIPSNTTQQVRSSFATIFLNKKLSYSRIGKDSKIKQDTKITALKNHNLEKDQNRQKKSTLFVKDNKLDKRILLNSTIKRCLCTLKKYKNHKKKSIAVATDSKTFVGKMYPEMKRPIRSSIDFGTDPQKTKMISKSSDTRKLPQNVKPKYLKESLRQVVQLGSNFSFNIEFYKDIIPDKCIDKKLKNMNVYFSNNNQKAKQLKIDDGQKSCLKTTKFTMKPSKSKSSLSIEDKQRLNNLMTPCIIKKPTQVCAMNTVAQTKMNLPEIILLNGVNLGPSCVDTYHLANCTEKTLNKTKKWQKKRSLSNVLSISIKSKEMQSCIDESKCNLLQISPLNQSLLELTSKETVRIESKFGFAINYDKKIQFKSRPNLRNTHSETDSFAQKQDEQKLLEIQETKNASIIINDKTNPPQLTGIQPFLRKCYCTMNIQVAQQSPRRRHRQQYPTKLKDYECEPGVCVPYECDPNECQKLIMKRLMKKVSRMSGTENRMKTSASITSCDNKCPGKKTRKLQSSSAGERHYRAARVRHTGLKYQTLPRSPITKRQAVRVGSNFSFNMEFSKGSSKSEPTAEFKEPIRPSTNRSSKTPYRHRRDRGTGYEIGRQHRESQSRIKQMRHRASSVTPMLRRCFCTLKLQKKGRQQKERELQLHQGTSTPPKFYVEKPILRTTETSQNTKIKRRFPELLPYECEPNICVPGECDPSECLELIKKRRSKYTRELGTDSMKSKITSSSSMTSSQIRTKRRHVQARDRPTKSRDTVKRREKSPVIESQVTPTRQAVRVGSSFSFNIEFFKDKTSPTDFNMRSPEIYEHKTPTQVKKVPRHVYVHHKVRESSSQDRRKSTRDTHSQIGLIKHGQSTMTGAFLKRCFCTAKLQGIKVDTEPKASPQRTSFSTMKRCLCHLKSLTAKKEPKKTAKVDNEQITPLPEQHVVKTQTRAHSPILEPYECEPGVCVPGLCDPYECEKMIKKRRAREKMAGTTRPRTKSTSSSFTSSRTSKAQMTQSKPARQYARTRKRNLSSRDMVVTDQLRTPVLPQKQVVKISSNFSFNIEFYKDKMPNLQEVQAAAIPVRRSRPTRDQAHEARKRYKDKRLMGRSSSVYTRGSQMDATKTKDQSLGPMLKRCFCTLKLHKEKHIKKDKQVMHQGTATPVVKEVPTLQSRSMMTANKYKLKPYECEPGVCVPGECDPFECQKRIKKRLMSRASGTLTDQYRTRSTASTIRPHRRYRNRDAQSTRRTKPIRTRDVQYKVRRPEIRSKVVERASKQAVNIGSNFSFNMEFFKDKSPGSTVASSGRMKQYGPSERSRRTASRSTEWQSSSRNKKAQRPRTVRDMDSQVLARKMRSTMTGVGPFLKRCFCTLQLHKSEKDEKPFNKPEAVSTKTEIIKSPPKVEVKHDNASTLTRTQFHNRKLEPYECEPGVCVPGECDPYECLKRIRRRMQIKQSSTDPHRGRSVSSSINESSKSRHRRIQALLSTPSGDRIRGEDRVPLTDGSPPNRQVVRIGSSFSFNVEFYKDKSSQLPSARDVTKIINRGIKSTETRPKRPRSTSSSKRANIRHCKSQSDCIKTECKSSCSPLLKRCFCTLKLQKMGKQQQSITTKIEPTMRTMGTRTAVKNKVDFQPVAREIGTKTKRYTRSLEPYECEPGVCVPGLCDPYECEKRIKMRNMKDFGTGTTRAGMKSMYSLTSRDMGTKAMNTYRVKNKKPHKQTVKRPRLPSRGVENGNRHSVHLGSNFSFNLEFFKDRSSDQSGIHHDDIQTHFKPRPIKTGRYKSKTSMSTANRVKLRNQGSHGRGKSLYHRQLQAGAQTESRGSGMGPLKRCFCTLTLQRAEIQNTLSSPVAKNTKVKTQDKKTSTKKYNPSPVPLQLEPYECEPYVCTPGECNPYECLERIKKRGIRRMSRTTGTRMKRTSQVSVSSMAAQFMPGYTSKRSQFKGEGFSPQKIERVVEEPRFSFLRSSPNRQGVKISSNFSFDIEFFKEVSTPGMKKVAKTCPDKEICKVKDTCTECKKTGQRTNTRDGQHGTRNHLHDNESQSEAVKTEDKSSAVAILRRCFCTAKLHRSNLARSHHPQTLTVGRVEEIRPLFGPKEYWVQYQTQQLTRKNNKSESTDMKFPTTKTKTISKKLETIMSYTPRRFNKDNGTIQPPMGKKSEANASTLRKMLKCCKNLFVRRIDQNENYEEEADKPTEVKPYKQPQIDVIKACQSVRHSYDTATTTIKKCKSLKVAKTSEKNVYKKKYSRFESGDAKQVHNAGNKPHKSGINFVKKKCPNYHVHFKQPMPSKQVHFSLSPKDKPFKSVMDSKESKSVSFLYKGSTFRKTENLKLCSNCGGFKRRKPLLSPGLDTTTAVILPKDSRERRKISCPCCLCRKREPRTNITKTEKQNTNVTKTETQHTNVQQIFYATIMPRKRKPCVCGSVPCKKEAEKLADEQYMSIKKTKTKKCVCGTNICAAESTKEALAKESGYMRDRRKKRERKIKEREAIMRDLKFKKEDKEILKRRKLNDKYMMKRLKKFKETSDIMLLAESLLDICKLGITSATDILRNVGRTVIDPKRTYRNLIMSFREPMRTWKKIQDAANDGPGVATLKRIKLRCKAMTCMKRNREKLESHPVTNFVLHANDKDPRRRLHPRKVKQPRVDPGFGCSPFMLSLRKRPWLSIYYTCTWFYPHCLSLLQVWRSFIDVMLFLLAAAVWSPCILCMELSRALMCCFLCTG